MREPGRATAVMAAARLDGFDVHANRLIFPETIVVFVHGSVNRLLAFAARAPGAISEIRKATGTIQPFLDRGDKRIGQRDFVAELAGRIAAPPGDAPVVCVLHTGVSAAHPLVEPGLTGVWAYDAAWGADDHEPKGGHGTGIASLVLYGDLEGPMNDHRQIQLTHAVESMKFLPPPGFPPTQRPSYGIVTQGAVAQVEIERPRAVRSFCVAASTAESSPARPSSWSGAIDQISAGSMPGDRKDRVPAAAGPKRLVLVATGNVEGGQREAVAAPQSLEDPAQSWNALSIGSYHSKGDDPAGRETVAPPCRGQRSQPLQPRFRRSPR